MTQKYQKTTLPGSNGEHELQKQFGNERRALAFYNKQVLDVLAPLMVGFLENQQMFFMATSDKKGNCDCSYRAGKAGFITVIDNKTIIYPEYRGNGVMAGLGNISENPRIGMVFIDFFETGVGLHVNGKAEIITKAKLDATVKNDLSLINKIKQNIIEDKTDCYVLIEVEEAYIHCSKHIPLVKKIDKEIHWGTDDKVLKGGDAFKVKNHPRPWVD